MARSGNRRRLMQMPNLRAVHIQVRGLRIWGRLVYGSAQSGRGSRSRRIQANGRTSPQAPPSGGRTALFEPDPTVRQNAARKARPPRARAPRQRGHTRRQQLYPADLARHFRHHLGHRADGGGHRRAGDFLLLLSIARTLGAVRRPGARRRDHAGPRGQGVCLAGRDLWIGQPRQDRACPAQRRRRDRGQAFLQPSGHRPARHRQRREDQHGRRPWPAGRQWRVHHHPAGLQAVVSGRDLRPHPLGR